MAVRVRAGLRGLRVRRGSWRLCRQLRLFCRPGRSPGKGAVQHVQGLQGPCGTVSGGRRRWRGHFLDMRVGWVLLAAGLAVGQLEAAGVRVLAVGVGASALVVAQAEGLVPHLGGELRGRRAGRGARLACGLFSVAARAFRGVTFAFAAAALVLALPRAFGRAGALLEQAVYVAADMR